MRLVVLVLACGLVAGRDGGARAVLPGYDSARRTRAAGSVLPALARRAADLLAEDPSTCFSLRENEEQRQLLCNDRRSKFNFNPFGLRFGKRHGADVYRRAAPAAKRARTRGLSLLPREPEAPA